MRAISGAEDVNRSRPETASSPVGENYVQLRAFRLEDLAALVDFWNASFADRRNFLPMTTALYERRVLACPAFDPAGLILAWRATTDGDEELVGLVHAMKPAPQVGIYARWGPQHTIALLYVRRDCRGQGVGGRLLQAAESWLYYCPVHFAAHSQPAYGSVEGPRPPFFGSTERMGISGNETGLLRFLARHGYRVEEAGDVSMTLATAGRLLPAPQQLDLSVHGLTLLEVSNQRPFTGREPVGRLEYTLWGDNQGDPYAGYLLVDDQNLLRGHLSWYPMPEPGRMALGTFWLAPPLRGRGLGAYLLDLSLHEMSRTPTHAIELHTHLTLYEQAVTLYQRRGFQIDAVWVNLVKT